MFQPNIKNFFLSINKEWKKQRAKSSFLYLSGLLHVVNCLSVIRLYNRFIFAFKPFGGSVVILIPTWSIEIGKSGCGEELSQRRKSGCGSSTCMRRWSDVEDQMKDLTCNCSTNLSNWGIQLSDRWQLARKTQLPSFTPSLIILVAIGACPWPSDRAWNLWDILHWSASTSSPLVGSWNKWWWDDVDDVQLTYNSWR